MTRNPRGSRGEDNLGDDEFLARWQDLTQQLRELDSEDSPPSPTGLPPAAPLGGGTGPRDYEPEEDDGAFVPPDPTIDMTAFSAQVRLGWFLLTAGLVGAVITYLTRGPSWVGIVCALMTAGGVISLVLSLPKNRDDDGPGAVV